MSRDARLFIAVDPPAPVAAQLAGWARRALEPGEPPADRQRSKPTASDGIRRVDAQDLHITVCFLGDQPLDTVDEIGELVRDAATALTFAGLTPGPLSIGAPVWLPPRRPRALALEIHDESGGLTSLFDDLRARLGSAIGWESERRRFRPHITVARLRSWAPPPACREPTPPLVFEADSIAVYRSRLEPDGAVYQALVRVGLEADPAGPAGEPGHGGQLGPDGSPGDGGRLGQEGSA